MGTITQSAKPTILNPGHSKEDEMGVSVYDPKTIVRIHTSFPTHHPIALPTTHSSDCWDSFFFLIYLLITLLQLSHFRPFTELHPAHPLPPTFPLYSSCPWVIFISSLASTFPTLFLPSPYFPPIIYAIYSLYLSPPLPLPIPY